MKKLITIIAFSIVVAEAIDMITNLKSNYMSGALEKTRTYSRGWFDGFKEGRSS